MSLLTLRLDSGAKFRLYSNVPLAGSETVDRAVIVIHGTDRNAVDYQSRMMKAANKASVVSTTAVITPWFEKSAWSDLWKQGGRSNGMSSFAVVDQLVGMLDMRPFPNLRRITVAGHSAGGQFVQRYAAFGKPESHLPVNFVVANPSSFMYLDAWRPMPIANCRGFNDYKYGLDRRPSYVGTRNTAQIIDSYIFSNVTVVNGALDIAHDSDLDTSCAAMMQGPHRGFRGDQFVQHIRRNFTSAHNYIVVPGVGHDSAKIFADPLLRPALFGVTQ